MFSDDIYQRCIAELEASGQELTPYAIFTAGYALAVAHGNPQPPAGFNAFATMLPSTFPQQNTVFEAPRDEQGERIEGIMNIPVHWHPEGLITCWKMTPEHVAEMNRTRRIFVSVLGHRLAPMMLQVHSPILELPADDTGGPEAGH